MNYHRREPRFELDQPVTITNLEHPGTPLLGRLVNFSAKGTRIILEGAVEPGTLVRVEWGGTVLLGEIVYCWQQGKEFAAGLELEDVLYETEILASMSGTWPDQAPAKH